MKLYLVLLAMSLIVIPGASVDTNILASNINGSNEVINGFNHLQDVIDMASPGSIIWFSPATYSGYGVTIDKSLTLVGAGPDKMVVDGGNTGPVFTIGKTNPDIDVKLSGMTIRGGSSERGAGISNYGRLTVEDSTITGNTAEFGAGIYNFKTGKLVLVHADVMGNKATSDGAGVYNGAGTLIINSGTITENTGEVGAGVFNDFGTMVINGGTIMKNTATSRCGGVLNLGDLDLRGGSIVDNTLGNVYTPSLT
jgi:hypothetical protein